MFAVSKHTTQNNRLVYGLKIDESSIPQESWDEIAEFACANFTSFGKVLAASKRANNMAGAFTYHITEGSSTTLVVDTEWDNGDAIRDRITLEELGDSSIVAAVLFSESIALPHWCYAVVGVRQANAKPMRASSLGPRRNK